MNISNAARFWRNVYKTDACWFWIGGKARGYGRFDDEHAHRYSYRLNVGEIPDRMQIHHKCRSKTCVNPDHLEMVKPGATARTLKHLKKAQTYEHYTMHRMSQLSHPL